MFFYKFFEDLQNSTLEVKTEETTDFSPSKIINKITNVGLYVLTFNSPNQFKTLIDSMIQYDSDFINKPEIPKDSDQYKLQDDGLSRGGAINTALSVKKDTSRISNFLYKTDKGTLFNIKQTGLFLSNPLLEQAGKQKFLSIGTTRAYNGGVNLLASVAGSPFGLHVTNFGLTPLQIKSEIDDLIIFFIIRSGFLKSR